MSSHTLTPLVHRTCLLCLVTNAYHTQVPSLSQQSQAGESDFCVSSASAPPLVRFAGGEAPPLLHNSTAPPLPVPPDEDPKDAFPTIGMMPTPSWPTLLVSVAESGATAPRDMAKGGSEGGCQEEFSVSEDSTPSTTASPEEAQAAEAEAAPTHLPSLDCLNESPSGAPLPPAAEVGGQHLVMPSIGAGADAASRPWGAVEKDAALQHGHGGVADAVAPSERALGEARAEDIDGSVGAEAKGGSGAGAGDAEAELRAILSFGSQLSFESICDSEDDELLLS